MMIAITLHYNCYKHAIRASSGTQFSLPRLADHAEPTRIMGSTFEPMDAQNRSFTSISLMAHQSTYHEKYTKHIHILEVHVNQSKELPKIYQNMSK